MKQIIFILLSFNMIFLNDRITYEKEFYDKYIESVFTVFGDASSGTGFLIDNVNGLIATNYHVVSKSRFIRVKLNQEIKVEGKIVAQSMYDDMAILQINPEFTLGLLSFQLAPHNYELYIGEPIYAIGSPLRQTELLSKGIISKVLDRAIISADLNINHGNSGGPLFNSEELVIGINSFVDFDNAGKLSGIIKIDPIYKLIEDAKLNIENNIPSNEKLPVVPTDLFPLDALRESVYLDYKYKDYLIKNSSYYITLSTPPYKYNKDKSYKVDLVEMREKRLNKKGINDSEILDDWLFDDLYSWHNYLNKYQPVVTLTVYPKSKMTAGAAIGNLLFAAATAYAGSYYVQVFNDQEYKTDLYDLKLYKNGTQIFDLQRYMKFIPLYTITNDYNMQDMARMGLYTFPIDAFSPINNEFVNLNLEIYDVSNPNEAIIININSEKVEKIWEDFLPYTQRYDEWNEIQEKNKIKKQSSISKITKNKKPW